MQTFEDIDAIAFARLATCRQAVKLEALGMKHSSRRSVTALMRRELGLAANAPHEDVLAAISLRMATLLEPS